MQSRGFFVAASAAVAVLIALLYTISKPTAGQPLLPMTCSSGNHSAVQLCNQGAIDVVRIDLNDASIQLRAVVAPNGGLATLPSLAGQNGIAAINAAYLFGECLNGINCGQGYTYVFGNNLTQGDPTTWQFQRSLGFDQQSNPNIGFHYEQGGFSWHALGGGPRFTHNGAFSWICEDGSQNQNCPIIGDQVVINGEVFGTSASTSNWWENDQSAIGYSDDRNTLYFASSNDSVASVTMQQLHDVLWQLGARNNLRLDGGSKRSLYYSDGPGHYLYTGPGVAGASAWVITPSDIPTPTPQPPPPATGWNQQFFSDNNLSSPCGLVRNETDVYIFRDSDVGWAPPPECGPAESDWSVRMERSDAYFQGGNYEFGLFYDDGARLYWHNGSSWQLIVDGWDATQHYESTFIPAGEHPLRLEYKNNAGHAIVQLWWRGPGALPQDEPRDPTQWYVHYWGNQFQWQDAVANHNEGTGFIARSWDNGGPGYGIPGDHFSTRFERYTYFECGTYLLHLQSDDGSRLRVDGVTLPAFDHWANGVWNTSQQVALSEGYHEIDVNHFENDGAAHLYFDWTLLEPCPPPLMLELFLPIAVRD